MRTIGLINGIPKETNTVLFPDSTIQNETATVDGTPVIREIYGDILTNFYKLLRLTKVTANNLEDNETNGYQIIVALQKMANSMNDVEQTLVLSSMQFSIGLDLSILPDKYVCVARAVEAFPGGTGFTFKGSDTTVYNFIAISPFNSGDEVLLIIDHSDVRAYNLNVAQNIQEFTAFGSPLAFNDSAKVYYQEQGILFSDKPEMYDLQAAIRTLEGNGTIIAYEMILLQNNVLCLGFFPSTLTYKVYQFAVGSFNSPVAMNMVGGSFPVGTDNKPNIYTQGTFLHITNSTGNSANDYSIDIYSINIATNTLTKSSSINIDSSFVKTTNAVIANNKIYTYVAGTLNSFDMGSGTVAYVGAYPGFIGLIFGLNESVYYSNGEVAKIWALS